MSNYDLAKFDRVMADVDAVAELGNFIPDMSTKDGYNASKRFVLDNTMPMRKALESAHKEIKAPFWDACKFLDGKKKELLTLIEVVEKPHKDAYKEHDAEIKRKKEEAAQAVQSRFDELDQYLIYSANPDVNSDSIQGVIDSLQDADVCPDFFGARLDNYIDKLNVTISQLSSSLTQKIQFEQMKKQQEEMEAKQREIERQQREIQEAKEKAEFEAAQEKRRIEMLELERQREIDRKEAEEKHAEEMKLLAEKQERERIEAEQKAKEDAERIAKEKAEAEQKARQTRTKNRNEAAKKMIDIANITKDQAISICNAIAAGEILFVNSNF